MMALEALVESRVSPWIEAKVWPNVTGPVARLHTRIRRRACVEIVMDVISVFANVSELQGAYHG
jgi:hypothetical protein